MEDFFRKYSIFFLVIILALSVFFRLYEIKTIPPGLYPDEAMNGNNLLEAIHTVPPAGGYKIFYLENNGREGLFMNIQSLAVKTFGNEPWALRLTSALFGIFTVLGLYLLTKELFKKESIALFASFFLATSFWHINFSRIGFRAIMAPFFLVWGIWLLFVSLRKKNLLWPLVGGLMFGGGFHSYIAYRATPIVLLPPFLNLLKNKKFLAIALFIIGTIITIYPLINYFYHNPQDFLGRTAQISIFSSATPILDLEKNILKTIGMFFWQGDLNWRHNLSGQPQLWWPVSILFLIGFILSIKNLRVTHYALLVTWFIFMLAPVVISNEGIPHALRAIIVIPVAMIFAALGLDWIINKVRQWSEKQIVKFPESAKQLLRIKKELAILLFVFFIAISATTFNQYFWVWAINPHTADAFSQKYADLGHYLKYSPQNIKKYVIINANGTDVRGIPMPSQTVMFLTDTFLPAQQKEKNIFYILPQNLDEFINKAKNENDFQIFILENDHSLRKKLSDNIPGLYSYIDSGLLIQQK